MQTIAGTFSPSPVIGGFVHTEVTSDHRGHQQDSNSTKTPVADAGLRWIIWKAGHLTPWPGQHQRGDDTQWSQMLKR